MRQLGIPTVIDRLVQQAILQVLEPLLDPTFSDSSYGFRPGRGAHDALAQAQQYVAEGRTIVVDMDLEKFFDRVNHDILMARLARRVADKRLLRIVRRFLEAGLMQDGVCVERHEGTPQGGPLSPLLANLLLDDLDKELERRGHCFCRYADDCNIYVQSQAAGERVLASVTRFLEGSPAAACQPGEECGGLRRGTQVPRPSAPGRRHAGDRPEESGAGQGSHPADHPAQSRRQLRADDRRTQLVPDRLGDLLPLRGVKTPPGGTGRLGSPQAALRAVEAVQAGQTDRGLPAPTGRAPVECLDDGRCRERLVAHGGQPFGYASHEQPVVRDTGPGQPRSTVRDVTT